MLSSVDMGKVERTLSIGPYSIPLGKPSIRPLRKSKPFWHTLGEHGVSSCVLRVPVTFPPEKYRGVLVSGMCVPDLLGTQGSFLAYTTRDDIAAEHGSGTVVKVQLEGDTVRTHVTGPENFLRKGQGNLRIPLKIDLDRDGESARITLDGQEFTLIKGQYSDWTKVSFRAGLGMNVAGICKLFLVEVKPHFTLYITPLNIDPRSPALPVSHPFVYSSYLSNLHGEFSTLGLAEDTWALSEGVIDEAAFLEQCYVFQEERERLLFNALDRTGEDMCVCVFDGTDRVQHMFWRYLDPAHPANRGKESEQHVNAIDDFYARSDEMIGRVMEGLNERDLLIVMSDHGFQPFSRGVNLNSWLHANGYLALEEGAQESGEWFSGVDWTRTKAYAIGLGGIYVNRRGREAQGIVASGDETEALKQELIARLSGLRDDEVGKVGISGMWDSPEIFRGPYLSNAPDMIIGYAAGYRASWDSVTGKVTSRVFEDNVMRWSGDHCIDPRAVPGVLFSNQKIGASNGKRHIMDIAPTVLRAFRIEKPGYMDGTALSVE
jgi:predicted AlkP superfamily phosphohydrolase/phosphomutase